MIELTRGGIVFDADLAIRIGELLCEAHYGADSLERQRPLTALDKGSYWRVEGSWNRDRKIDGIGAFHLSMDKRDGRVTRFGLDFVYHADPSVIPLIKQHLAQKKSNDTD
jgi:hypothetical protein